MKLTGSQAHIDLARSTAAEGMVLLKNQQNVLPLPKGSKVAVFGQASIAYLYGGLGSSNVTCAYSRNLYDGLAVKEAEGKVAVFAPLADYYRQTVTQEQARVAAEKAQRQAGASRLDQGDWMARFAYYQDLARDCIVRELPVPQNLMDEAAAFTDTAIVVLSRISGEGFDRLCKENDYLLSKDEQALIDNVKTRFAKCILVLNIGGVTDITALAEDDRIHSILLAWQAGMEGGLAMADILCGDVNPSGKLADTYARSFMDYPSSPTLDDNEETDDDHVYVEYFEDIYVGYRYFETIPGAKEKVLYPFGFGLSYTTFALTDITCAEEQGIITAAATVTNTGNVPGKEVMQVYFSAPQGLLGKPAKQLCGYQKTRLLAPGESQQLTVTFPVTQMASFDDLGKVQTSAYLLEKGDYTFHIGTSVRDTVQADFTYHVEADTVTEQLSSLCAPNRLARRMLADGSYEDLPQSSPKHFFYHHETLGGTAPKETVTFDKVGKEISLADFLAQFSDSELCQMVGGDRNVTVHACNTACYPGNQRLGIVPLHTADGPAGLRILPDRNIPTTAFPCATLLACTWDPQVVAAFSTAAAKEVRENGMLVWLAPGLNIHRTPLCGRNFEYYSEDPFLSGTMAAAGVRSIQAEGIACSIKHFACNNRELYRRLNDSRLSERALREIYLKGFEICVKTAHPWTVMSSYNLVNGIHASENGELLEGILRHEWGFDGMVTTDWGIKNDPIAEVKAGNDLKMPTGYPEELEAALTDGTLTRGDLENCVSRILHTYQKIH